MMTPSKVSDTRYQWNLTTIFPDYRNWHAELTSIRVQAQSLAKFQGTLLQSPQTLADFLARLESLGTQLGRVYTYAHLTHSLDMRNDESNAMMQLIRGLTTQVDGLLAFYRPEILSFTWNEIDRLITEHPALERYRFFLSKIERARPHTLSSQEEAIASQLSTLAHAPESIRDAVHDGDMRFRPIRIADENIELTHGTIDEYLQHPTREVRRTAYQSYTDGYMANSGALGSTLTWEATSGAICAKIHHHRSTFQQRLFFDDLSPAVYHAVIRSCREHYPLFQRYFRARAAVLKIDKTAAYDIFAPLSQTPPSIPYDDAVALVLESLSPLGEEYISVARRGLLEEHWADVYPRPGKYSNAFSSGCYGTRPFFLLNYAPTMPEVGTLAHELGHSMHSFFTHRAQPSVYSQYAMTVAETASNLNQVLLRAHTLKHADRETSLAVLDEAFFFVHRYLFMMPTISRVEHTLHTLYARSRTLSTADIRKATVTAFSAAYGNSVEYEPERLGMMWAQFCHLYRPYYMFQYAIGISAAMAIGHRLLSDTPGARERYIEFLSLGASRPPIEIFKVVGVDITDPQTYREAFKVVAGYVEKLEWFAANDR